MINEVTAGIKVSVETFYQPSHSNPSQLRYVFAYQILIENDSEYTVQLLRRHWYISDANGVQREVEGEGVVGETPTIAPGSKYQYTSGCDLSTDIGRMKGSYLMQKTINGEYFDVNIPDFLMVAPFKLN
jgi:ApaG protein